MRGVNVSVTAKAPKTLVLNTSWKTERDGFSGEWVSGRLMPALLIRTSMWPYFPLIVEAAEAMEESSVTSSWMASTEQPAFLSSAAAVSPFESVRQPIRTW